MGSYQRKINIEILELKFFLPESPELLNEKG
jgi:hypothetical protein